MMNRHVFADRNGAIDFGPFVPNGRLPIAKADSSQEAERIREIVEGICRYAYDGKTLLVPGIPEADTDAQALDALMEFRQRVADRLELGLHHPAIAPGA
jgi:hypothetical protein